MGRYGEGRLLADFHPADTAGGIMQTEYVSVPQYATVEQAIGLIRRARDDVPEVHNVFVVNLERRVIRVLLLMNLVLARPDESVANVMERQVISVSVETAQDEVARVLEKYDLVSIPVVDRERRLVGLITAVASYLINMGSPDIVKLSLAVLIGMVISVTVAALVGTVQIIVFYKLKRDPAVAAGPLVTAFNDLLGTTLYLVVATAFQA